MIASIDPDFGVRRGFNYSTQGSHWLETDSSQNDIGESFIDKIIAFFSIRHLNKKIQKINAEFASKIETGVLKNETDTDRKRLEKTHEEIVKFLKKTNDFPSVNKSNLPDNIQHLHENICEFINLAKKMEMKLRIELYPDRNEITLTYDELRELNELTDLTF